MSVKESGLRDRQLSTACTFIPLCSYFLPVIACWTPPIVFDVNTPFSSTVTVSSPFSMTLCITNEIIMSCIGIQQYVAELCNSSNQLKMISHTFEVTVHFCAENCDFCVHCLFKQELTSRFDSRTLCSINVLGFIYFRLDTFSKLTYFWGMGYFSRREPKYSNNGNSNITACWAMGIIGELPFRK